MEKEFIPYEQALALKELDFKEKCFTFYEFDNHSIMKKSSFGMYGEITNKGLFKNDILAPLYQQAFRWFRDNYDLVHFITPEGSLNNRCYLYSIKDYRAFKGTFGQTYEEAKLNCLKELIEIVKNK